jgi:hypothetical protein
VRAGQTGNAIMQRASPLSTQYRLRQGVELAPDVCIGQPVFRVSLCFGGT